MSEPVEAQIARLAERMNTILEEMAQARDGRKHQYEKLEDLGRSILKLDNRVESVENSLARASPTIDEFITIKHKVAGAGMLGKYVWAIGGGLLSALAFGREAIFAWFAK